MTGCAWGSKFWNVSHQPWICLGRSGRSFGSIRCVICWSLHTSSGWYPHLIWSGVLTTHCLLMLQLSFTTIPLALHPPAETIEVMREQDRPAHETLARMDLCKLGIGAGGRLSDLFDSRETYARGQHELFRPAALF